MSSFNKISSLLDKATKYFSESIHHPLAIGFLRKAVYIVTICYTVFMANEALSFWGETSLIGLYDFPKTFMHYLLRLMLIEEISECYFLFIALNIIACLVGLTERFKRISAFVVYVTSINLYVGSTAVFTTNAGMNLMFLMPFYLMFMCEKPKERWSNRAKKINHVFTNFGFWAARLQLVVVYLVSGLYKLGGEAWLNGQALYYSLSVEEFSQPFVREYLLGSDFIMVTGSYFGLVYQLLFPVLVWFKKIRGYYLIAGIFFHFCIAFMMELPDFGFAMIAAYAVFIDEEKYQKAIDFFGRIRRENNMKIN